MLNVVIIEDEKLTAQDLANTLHNIDHDIEIQKILYTVEEAVLYFQNNLPPDLIFSDIQLPDGNSFEIFKKVKLSIPVIFCTAFDQYALKAFEVNGIDYLLKPFTKNSVSNSIEKYRLLKGKAHYQPDTFIQIMDMIKQAPSIQNNSIIVNKGDKIIPIEIKSIALFYLEDNYVFVLTFGHKKHIISHTLEELEKLCGTMFFRANRQYLVNRKAIKNATRYLNRKILIHLTIDYENQILVGKLKTTQFLEWLAVH